MSPAPNYALAVEDVERYLCDRAVAKYVVQLGIPLCPSRSHDAANAPNVLPYESDAGGETGSESCPITIYDADEKELKFLSGYLQTAWRKIQAYGQRLLKRVSAMS